MRVIRCCCDRSTLALARRVRRNSLRTARKKKIALPYRAILTTSVPDFASLYNNIKYMDPPPTARSADLLLPSRAARLDRGRGLLIANVDDAPRDALSERELQDLRKTAGRHARSFYGRSTARVRPQPLRTCSLPVAAALRPTIHRQTMSGRTGGHLNFVHFPYILIL